LYLKSATLIVVRSYSAGEMFAGYIEQKIENSSLWGFYLMSVLTKSKVKVISLEFMVLKRNGYQMILNE